MPKIRTSSKHLRNAAVAAATLWLSLMTTLLVSPTTLAAESGYTPCSGGLLVVMNRNIDIQSIDDQELRRLFLGKSRRLPNGARAALASFGPETSFFNERLLGLSDAEVATIWSRLRFSGRTPPPRTFDSIAEVLAFVESRANALAYIPSCVATDSVRVFSSLPR